MRRFRIAFVAVVVLTASTIVADDNLDESKAIAKIELLGGKITKDETSQGGAGIAVDFKKTVA